MIKYLFCTFIILSVFSKHVVESYLLVEESETIELLDIDGENEKGEEKLELKDHFLNTYSIEYQVGNLDKMTSHFQNAIEKKYHSCREVLTPPPDFVV